MEPPTATRAGFKPGDHLRVRRPVGYFHHGIVVGEDEVVQFGGGKQDNEHAAIVTVPLMEFEHGDHAELVRHGTTNSLGLLLPEADSSREEIVRRARWLASRPSQPYNLVGHNCEHVANWCATGYYTESHQTRNMSMAAIPVEAGLHLYFSYRMRNGTITSRLVLIMALVFGSVFVANVMYHRRIGGFVRMLRDYPQ